MSTTTIPFQWTTLESKWVFDEKELRLNASSYSFDAVRARKLLEVLKERTPIETVENLAEKIFVGARVKRLFTTKEEGIPYLMPVDLFMFHLKPRKWVRKETEDLENWWVDPLTILITQSGTPGRCLLVNKLFKDKVVSPNVVRVAPNDTGKNIVGYLYAYLNTWVGQAFLTKTKYGATVKHIEPEHVANIPIPLLPESELKKINNKILEAHRLREEAQELLNKAEELFYRELGLPRIDEKDVEYFDGEQGKIVRAFVTKASELELRLDATYNNPLAKYVLSKIKSLDVQVLKFENIIDKIFIPPRFKRPYTTDSKNGVPYLLPSQLPLVKYFDVKYLLPNFKNADIYRLEEGYLLVVTDGTVGWASLVTKYISGWFGSNNFARIKIKNAHPGYVLGFILTEYGQVQLKRDIFGGVISHITEEHIKNIWIPLPDYVIQEKIGKLVIEAYNKKDQANIIESEAVQLLERKLATFAHSR